MKVFEGDPVGIVRGEASFSSFEFSVSPEAKLSFGEFVVTKNRNGEWVIGTVRKIENMNWLLSGGKSNYNSLLLDIHEYGDSIGVNEEIRATVRILGKLSFGSSVEVLPNRVPIPNGEFVYLASDEVLEEMYRPTGGSMEVGTLLMRDSVKISLDVDELVSRHFAVLAVTGAGKSNAIAVMVAGIVEGLGGTVVVLDPHGDYVRLRLPKTGDELVNVIDARITPELLDSDELAEILGVRRDAQIQRTFLERAWDTVRQGNQNIGGRELLVKLREKLNEWVENGGGEYWDPFEGRYKKIENLDSNTKNTILKVVMRISRFLRNYGHLLTSEDLLAKIEAGKVNVIDLAPLEEEQMKVVVSRFLRRLFEARVDYESALKREESGKVDEELLREKRRIEGMYPALTEPVLVIVEEAHIFAPQGEESDVARILGRIAREGRKFGVGLGIVSQRPNRLNEDVLSQTNTKIILRIVNPKDQEYVLRASEQLSKDLLDDIAGLGRGEAVIVGQAVKLPALVKIYDFKKLGGNYGGGDIGVVERWKKRVAAQKAEKEVERLYGELGVDVDW
ncbi:DNA double-strand break repair helicase HerA [Pyrococcus yayanosii]|nr:DNA double-strand break repair helicase HerA [Pyrococcus yayanosii]